MKSPKVYVLALQFTISRKTAYFFWCRNYAAKLEALGDPAMISTGNARITTIYPSTLSIRTELIRLGLIAAVVFITCVASWSEGKRKIVIDQDAAGPAGTDQQSILMLIQSPETEVLGITVVIGNGWLHEEVAHTLRMLELIGRTDIPVLPGAEYPLVRRKQTTELWEQRYGFVPWIGAWTPSRYHPPEQLGAMPEGKPTTESSGEDAASHGTEISRRGHDLRRWPHDESRYRYLHRSGIFWACERSGLHGSKPQSPDQRPRVY